MEYKDWERIVKYQKKKMKELDQILEESRRKKLEDAGLTMQESKYKSDEEYWENKIKNSDPPNTISNGTAVFIYIVAMCVSLLFKGGWALCILETIILYKHLTRHKKK